MDSKKFNNEVQDWSQIIDMQRKLHRDRELEPTVPEAYADLDPLTKFDLLADQVLDLAKAEIGEDLGPDDNHKLKVKTIGEGTEHFSPTEVHLTVFLKDGVVTELSAKYQARPILGEENGRVVHKPNILSQQFHSRRHRVNDLTATRHASDTLDPELAEEGRTLDHIVEAVAEYEDLP